MLNMNCKILIPFSDNENGNRSNILKTVIKNLNPLPFEIIIGVWNNPLNKKLEQSLTLQNIKIINLKTYDFISTFNQLVKITNTDIICFHCADCLCPNQKQYIKTYKLAKENNIVNPFSKPFVEVKHDPNFNPNNYKHLIKWELNHYYCGGIFFVQKSIFLKIGMLNENIKHWGPDDKCLIRQANAFGIKRKTIDGPILHFQHNRNNKHKKYSKQNKEEFRKLSTMTNEKAREYIDTWKF